MAPCKLGFYVVLWLYLSFTIQTICCELLIRKTEGGSQCSRLKSSLPFERDLDLQNTPLSRQPFKTQPWIENEDVTWSLQYNLPTTPTNKHTTFSLQEVEFDGWFLTLHIELETCTIWFMYKFNTSLVFHFCILRLTSWIWTNASTEQVKLESPSKWNSNEGFDLERWREYICWLKLTITSIFERGQVEPRRIFVLGPGVFYKDNLPTTRTNKHTTLSRQEVEFDGWFLTLPIVLETCTI